MKLTEKRLKEIIKEEIAKLQEADDYHVGVGGKKSATVTRDAVKNKTRALGDKLATQKANIAFHDKREAALETRVSTKRADGFPLDIYREEWYAMIRPYPDLSVYAPRGVSRPLYYPNKKPKFPEGTQMSAEEFFQQHTSLGRYPFRDVSLEFVKVLLANAETHQEELQAVINQYSQGEK